MSVWLRSDGRLQTADEVTVPFILHGVQYECGDIVIAHLQIVIRREEWMKAHTKVTG